MGESDMPYLYDPPSARRVAYPYSDFNPKAVTEASYARLSQQSKPKADGPLINFNQHPDSYVVVGGKQTEHKPLPAGTKKAIVSVRWVQFGLRILQEIAALGLLVATICITEVPSPEMYLLRIPQAWDSLIGLYAIYHLVRKARNRPAPSSAAYHTFALIMDTALIPLYVYIALATNANRQLPLAERNASGAEVPGNWRWTSFFATQNATDLLLLVTFIGGAMLAGLHLLSAGPDLYLIITFKRIASLPPDMNPLEDNLTSRRMTKHKHKNSELTLNTNPSMADVNSKRFAYLSGSTLLTANESRLSVAKDSMMNEERNLPFGHSRTGSKTSLAFSPHNPESARLSKHQYDGQQELYQEAVTNPRRSRYEVRPDGKLEVRSRRGSQSPSKRGSVVVETSEINRHSRNRSLSPTKRGSFVDNFELPPLPGSAERLESHRPASYIDARSASPAVPNAAAPRSELNQEQNEQLLSGSNWYVLDEDTSDLGTPSRQRTPAHAGYHSMHNRHDSFAPVAADLMPKPLGMHPPTPPMPEEYPDPEEHPTNAAGVNRSLTASSAMTASSSQYSESAPSLMSSKAGPGTPKGKYYGDLAAATRGVRGEASNPYGSANSNSRYGLPPSPEPSRTPSPEKRARVISRTGVDIADESVLFVPESKFSMRNRREVSGKVAEEGRGSWGLGNSWGSRN